MDRRTDITEEPEPAGSHHDPRHQDVDWIGAANQGGGYVPPDFEWTTNPKQDQDELEGEWPHRSPGEGRLPRHRPGEFPAQVEDWPPGWGGGNAHLG